MHDLYLKVGPSETDLLGTYPGVLISDGYAAYQTLARGSPNVLLMFCRSHVRRQFFEALPAYPQCQTALDLIAELYRIERKLPASMALVGDERAQAHRLRTKLRQTESGPLVAELAAWAHKQQSLPQSSLRKAIEYMLHL